VVRPALLWPELVLSVVHGIEAPSVRGVLEFQMALLCRRCDTVFVAPSPCAGSEWVDTRAELDAALAPVFDRYVDECVQCTSRLKHVPRAGSQPCAEAHHFTAAAPGPVNEGDQRWCTRCGHRELGSEYRKLAVVAEVPGGGERLLPAHFFLDGGGGA